MHDRHRLDAACSFISCSDSLCYYWRILRLYLLYDLQDTFEEPILPHVVKHLLILGIFWKYSRIYGDLNSISLPWSNWILSFSRPNRRFGENNTKISSEGLGRHSFSTGNRVGKFALHFVIFRISFTYNWKIHLPSCNNLYYLTRQGMYRNYVSRGGRQ